MKRRRLRLVAIMLSAGCLLAACSSKPHPVCKDEGSTRAHFGQFADDLLAHAPKLGAAKAKALEADMMALTTQANSQDFAARCGRLDELRQAYGIPHPSAEAPPANEAPGP